MIELWPENTNVGWWNGKLNSVINKFNKIEKKVIELRAEISTLRLRGDFSGEQLEIFDQIEHIIRGFE